MEHTALTKAELTTLSDVLLNSDSSFIQLRDAAQSYLNGLEAITSVEKLRFDSVQPLFLESGKAITPFSAAHCITDFLRTTAFVRGLQAAILAARQRFGKIPIHVCYAGTGPYAALMLPQTTRFSPEEVQFTLIEAHPVTLEILQTIIAHFELGPYVKKIIFEDATQIQLDTAEPIHILITETMQAGLAKEPQVAITQHLTPQLADDAFFLPELVHIWAGMYNRAKIDQHLTDPTFSLEAITHRLGSLMHLQRLSHQEIPGEFPIHSFEITESLASQHPQLYLFTEITVFDQIKLKTNATGLNLPEKIMDFAKTPIDHPTTFHFQYQISTVPGFKYWS